MLTSAARKEILGQLDRTTIVPREAGNRQKQMLLLGAADRLRAGLLRLLLSDAKATRNVLVTQPLSLPSTRPADEL